jgi:hypothetical protein
MEIDVNNIYSRAPRLQVFLNIFRKKNYWNRLNVRPIVSKSYAQVCRTDLQNVTCGQSSPCTVEM